MVCDVALFNVEELNSRPPEPDTTSTNRGRQANKPTNPPIQRSHPHKHYSEQHHGDKPKK